ncbi:DUF3429 domain-containing protein [Alloyangia pacifica]|uniref:DUF3429 domain-containing protein n=1 Tax=Alloyangia pacifica TaxID=311180 RepID=A0A1I6VA13_9RHOB|nr:DUF3429 domain-containing protein [Alloyangia pacifica]SDH87770.1 Protein of unknown function [Alloyangia pacifica]SFT10485.1 Protein of unknown function [Alloyangia pacifica]
MSSVPRAPLILAFAGLLPFLWSVATRYNAALYEWSIAHLGSRFVAPYLQLSYGTVILAFMSGVLWGFATKAGGAKAATAYFLSVLPALWAFFMVGGGPVAAATNLVFGFLGLLLLDACFQLWNLTPRWWLSLRVPLTAVVVACLSVEAFL